MRYPAAILLTCALAACAENDPASYSALNPAGGRGFPDVISLPDGFWPEGIDFGRGSTFYVGSLANGAIYRADARTGEGSVLVEADALGEKVGIRYDSRGDRLFVAGGFMGTAYVYDASSGALLASYVLAEPGMSLINDMVIAPDAVYFTDSFNAVLHVLPLGPGGSLPAQADVTALPITGDFLMIDDSPIGNANGIVLAPGGRELIVNNTTTGLLYRIDRMSGESTLIELDAPVMEGDGMVLVGHTLYVVQGPLNSIAVIRLSAGLATGTTQEQLTHPGLMFPSTIAQFGDALYAVNARFDVEPHDTVHYSVVRVQR